jgi:hypothetical protein
MKTLEGTRDKMKKVTTIKNHAVPLIYGHFSVFILVD